MRQHCIQVGSWIWALWRLWRLQSKLNDSRLEASPSGMWEDRTTRSLIVPLTNFVWALSFCAKQISGFDCCKLSLSAAWKISLQIDVVGTTASWDRVTRISQFVFCASSFKWEKIFCRISLHLKDGTSSNSWPKGIWNYNCICSCTKLCARSMCVVCGSDDGWCNRGILKEVADLTSWGESHTPHVASEHWAQRWLQLSIESEMPGRMDQILTANHSLQSESADGTNLFRQVCSLATRHYKLARSIKLPLQINYDAFGDSSPQHVRFKTSVWGTISGISHPLRGLT